ncbi:MAG: gamma-glutamyltranspeptidase/glutathione hydrolase, partial [Oleiphilaceae bacterium]
MKRLRHHLSLIFLLITSLSLSAQQATDLIAPEVGTTIQAKSSVTAKNYIAVTAHPLASQAAYEVLKQGGNAIDAMVAV